MGSGVEMSTFIAWVVYVGFALGYLAMLTLTERSAGHYVRSGIRERHPRTEIRVVAPPAPALTARSTTRAALPTRALAGR